MLFEFLALVFRDINRHFIWQGKETPYHEVEAPVGHQLEAELEVEEGVAENAHRQQDRN